MTRYYYDCPLKAGYMAVYHGVRSDAGPVKFYVVEECVRMLEPLDGDHCQYEHYSTQLSSYGGSWENGFMNWPPSPYGGCGYHSNDKDCRNLKIILRGNKAFIWPEVEE